MTNRLNLFTLFRNNISNVLCSSRTHKHIFDGKSFKRNFSIYSRFFFLFYFLFSTLSFIYGPFINLSHTHRLQNSTEPTRCQTPLHTQAAPTRRCIGWNSTEESSLCGSRTWSTLHRRNKVSENLISFLVQFMLLVFYYIFILFFRCFLYFLLFDSFFSSFYLILYLYDLTLCFKLVIIVTVFFSSSSLVRDVFSISIYKFIHSFQMFKQAALNFK